MTYKVVLVHSDEGYTALCPQLPGCLSEGQTAEEAMENLRKVIPEYLAVAQSNIKEPTAAFWACG